MSNLLNNGKPRKRLLERGPKIVPEQEFKLDTNEDAIRKNQSRKNNQLLHPTKNVNQPKLQVLALWCLPIGYGKHQSAKS